MALISSSVIFWPDLWTAACSSWKEMAPSPSVSQLLKAAITSFSSLKFCFRLEMS